ncbi:hypothetical protein PV433_17685 [Paenibacillus sp. GYB004]
MKEPMLKKAMDTLEFLSQDAAARMAYSGKEDWIGFPYNQSEMDRKKGNPRPIAESAGQLDGTSDVTRI